MVNFLTIIWSVFVGIVFAYSFHTFFALREFKKDIKILESIDEKNLRALESSDKIIDTQDEIIKIQYIKMEEYKKDLIAQDNAIVKMRDALIQLSPEFAKEYSKIKMSIN